MKHGAATIPKRLRSGDAIGIVSPSTPVTPDLKGQFLKGRTFLEALGFKLIVGEHVSSTSFGYAASPQQKAEDINRMFADESIRAILCSQGGATANACLISTGTTFEITPRSFWGLVILLCC